jgi:hypothetical protein
MNKQEKKPIISEPLKCGHCGNYAPMEKGASFSKIEQFWEHTGKYGWEEGPVYDILECLSCRKITLARYDYDERFEEDGTFPYQVLYPSDDRMPAGLPKSIERAYEAALKIRAIDANAYGVLLGRLLEMIVEDREAAGKDLNAKLADLAGKGEIPNNLVSVANGLRKLRNVGAHAMLGELGAEEVPILGDLAKAILEYVYSARHLTKLAEEKLTKLKARKKK